MFMHQDSGTTSYGIQADGERWFVKQSTDPSIVESLRRAVQLHTTVQHDALPSLRNTFEIPNGLALVYEWVPGEVLNAPRFTREQRRHDSAHPHVRFRSLPLRQVVDALDTVYDVHLVLAERGFVGCPASTIFASLASISFAGSPPRPGPVAGLHRCGSWGRQIPG